MIGSGTDYADGMGSAADAFDGELFDSLGV